MNKGVKIGIALEGGGAKGAYQAGVLRALNELKLQYHCVVGTSIGALNASSYILKDYDKCAKFWQNTSFVLKDNGSSSGSSSIDIEKFKYNIDEFERDYLDNQGIDSEPIVEFIKKFVDEGAIRNSSMDFGITTYCLTDRKPLKLYKEDIPQGMLHEFIFASCNLPVFKARSIDGKHYLDGSFFSKLPVEMALEKGCDVVIAVRLRPDKYDFHKYNNVKIIDIAPDEFLSSTLEASRERIVWMMEKGYRDAMRILKTQAFNLI